MLDELTWSEEFVREHVVGFGWELSGPMIVVVAQIDPAPPYQPVTSIEDQRGWQERFANAWRQVAAAVDKSIPIADFGSEVVAVLPPMSRVSRRVQGLVKHLRAAFSPPPWEAEQGRTKSRRA